ncbi:YdeI/OmpD-associated family protein [Chryseosolibacter indicus]|uniref:YdeI/OmpD-associated family protein n=1 Tax=Chryseosolibacter indicus TaxID=2782351 RepID=A0ABS5VR25_9BACT|nr:YdeI/OmpD-associated family protein [Chryseosolibacter indicus]MBT1703899.1 YdeI/OmpD-associated family protein [Chryseosolibacter indicus]
MPASKFIEFTAPLEEVDRALIKTVVFIPAQIIKSLSPGRHRVKGTMNGAPFALAIQYRKEGNSFFVVSSALAKAAKVKPGMPVKVKFHLVDPDKVDVPEELEAVLAQDDQGKKAWDQITTGLQRSLIIYINGVKNVDSRIKRALFIINKAKAGEYSKEAIKKRTKPKE